MRFRKRSWLAELCRMNSQTFSPRQRPFLYLSLLLNCALSYYVLNLKITINESARTGSLVKYESDISKSLQINKCPICKCETDEADHLDDLAKHKESSGTLQFPVPSYIPSDSSDKFVVDIGSYEPLKNDIVVTSILKRPSSCDAKVKLVIGIKSISANFERRNAIRKTWGNSKYFEEYPAAVVFLLGIEGKENIEYKTLEDPDDIIVGNYSDSFHNLTYKDSMLLTWVKHECPKVEYIFKGDDDTLVNPFELIKLLNEDQTRQRKQKTESAAIYGALLENQPVERHSTKYGDNLWPENKYPTYVSGGGFLMNRLALESVQYYIKITPKINIDDAFIGVLMKRAGLTDNLFRDLRFHSWGFKPYFEKQYDVCEINKVIYFHKFLPEELDCFWTKFIENRQYCKDPDYKYEEEGGYCNRNLWYKSHLLNPPNLNDENYHRCGPDFNNSICSVNEADWKLRQPWNGPCCSPGGYCGTTPAHCTCNPGCVDFQSIMQRKLMEKNNLSGKCCETIKVDSGLTYTGIYKLDKETKSKQKKSDGYATYSRTDKKGFTIQFGGFSVHGTGWYILAKEGGGLAWQLKDTTTCPPLGDWDGYGAVFSCVPT